MTYRLLSLLSFVLLTVDLSRSVWSVKIKRDVNLVTCGGFLVIWPA